MFPTDVAREGEEAGERAPGSAGESDADAMEGSYQEESKEARAAAQAHDPRAPTRAEFDRHMPTHMPYHAWRLWFITGRQHRPMRGTAQAQVSVVAMDWCFITDASTPVLCLKCSRTGVMAAHAVRAKEAAPELARLVASGSQTHWTHPRHDQERQRASDAGTSDEDQGEEPPHYGGGAAGVRTSGQEPC